MKRNFYLTGTAILAAVFVLIYIGVFFYPGNTPGKQEKTKAQNTVYIEKTDVETPGKIEELKLIAQKKIIPAKTLQENFQDKQETQQRETAAEEQANIRLETKKPEEINENMPVRTENRNSKASEMYVHDLLLIDYRKYRSKPMIKTEQAIITGTPANMESQESEIEEDQWKTVDVPYVDYVDKTMGIFAKGNYKKALTRYLEILKTYPDDLNASFYGALCYYNLGEFEKAYSLFSTCKAHKFNNFREESSWYGAKSLVALKENEKAKYSWKKSFQAKDFMLKKRNLNSTG